MSETDSLYDSSYLFLINRAAGFNRWQHRLNTIVRHYRDIAFPLKIGPGETLLDVGCMLGDVGHYLKPIGVKTYGVDICFDCLLTGREIFGNQLVSVARGEHLPFRDESFDYVTSQDVFEHLPSQEAVDLMIGECSRVARANRIVHKITVLEDKDWIDADETHLMKRSAEWWTIQFAKQGWKIIAPTTRTMPLPNRKLQFNKMHGYFLLERF